MNYYNVNEKNIKRLSQIVPIVDRVHGDHHPEFHEVRKIFEDIIKKLNNEDNNLSSEFYLLREITNNYTIPSDVCETYETVYVLLKELDNMYFLGKDLNE